VPGGLASRRRPPPLYRLLGLVEAGVVAVLASAAFVVGVMQVVLRYAFNTGFPWSEGIFVTLTVWAMLLSGSRAVRDRIHIRVDFFVQQLPRRMHGPIELIANLVSFGLCAFFAYCGFLYTRFVWQIDAVSTDAGIAEWIIFAVVPVAMTAFALRYLQIIWRIVASSRAAADAGHAGRRGPEKGP
jgi:C4-dicarboxylate transporter DctQ subunit